jgi:hypothetical protein
VTVAFIGLAIVALIVIVRGTRPDPRIARKGESLLARSARFGHDYNVEIKHAVT